MGEGHNNTRVTNFETLDTMSLLEQDRKADSSRTSRGKSAWNKALKGFRARFLPAATSTVKTSVGNVDDSLSGMDKTSRKRKHVGLVQRFRSLFHPHTKKKGHQDSSGMSSFRLKYGLVQDRKQNVPSTASPLVVVKPISKAGIVLKHYQHRSKADISRKSITDVGVSKSNDSDPMHTFTKAGSKPASEESIPLLEQATEGCHSAFESSSLLECNPLTSHNLPPPWILRKWKLRDSQKLLSIDPAKELLFHQTDQADKQYKCTIKLENKTRRYIAFKFKSNSPQGYVLRPKHGVLAPNTAIEVTGLKFGDPLSSPRGKKDLFVIVTVPIPTSVIRQNPYNVSSSILDKLQAHCCCEAILHAVFGSWDTNVSEDSCFDGQAKTDAWSGGKNYILTSISEEVNFENQETDPIGAQ